VAILQPDSRLISCIFEVGNSITSISVQVAISLTQPEFQVSENHKAEWRQATVLLLPVGIH